MFFDHEFVLIIVSFNIFIENRIGSSNMNKQTTWYVLFVKTGEEIKIAEKLNKQYNDKEINFFCPIRRLKIRRKGVMLWEERLLFPSYVIVSGTINDEDYYLIKRNAGIHRWLGDADGPISLYQNEVIILSKLMRSDYVIDVSKGIKVGKEVTIIDGPLKNNKAIITKVDARKQRAKVKFSICGEERMVDLGLEFIA